MVSGVFEGQRISLTVASPYTGTDFPFSSCHGIRAHMTARLAGPPKQIRQYSQSHFRNESGFHWKKKTSMTLKAIANDHQGSDCMNLCVVGFLGSASYN